MTYCLSLLCREGIVFLSDSRTSAGVDNINVRPKMRTFSVPGERVLCLMSSGNLSLTQSVVALIEEDTQRARVDAGTPHLLNQASMFATARYVGTKIREVAAMDRAALERDGLGFNINILLGGQIAGLPPEIHAIYPQGNSLKANVESSFLQIGEYKYGKPILDRGFNYETRLPDAVKFAILSMEATVKSNVAVGPPFDIFMYEKDSLEVRYQKRFANDDVYFMEIQRKWGEGIVHLVEQMPWLQFPVPTP